ncbi:MAG: biopolymer transporter ExbD [Spirochaetes bacterium]|nr:biopolymer transporter ExbD [Spirochaetota bacterium]MBN2769969.1 biopolymer transporter ExbD [Spirochaetota bacterium]
MKVRRNSRGTSEINLSSSSDIAFLLIIFFMVTSAFIFKDGLKLVLSAKSKEPRIIENLEDISIVSVTNDKLTLQQKDITPLNLEAELKEIIHKDSESVVLLQIEKDTRYERVIEIVDIMKVADVKRLSMKLNKEKE